MRNARRTLGIVVAAGLLAAACGSDDSGDDATDDDGATTEPADTGDTGDGGEGDEGEGGESEVDGGEPGGVFRRAVNLIDAGGLCFDPAAMGTGQYQVTYPVHASLLTLREGGEYEPDLAVRADVVDESTIEVELQPDLSFSDGTPLDAQAAADSIIRTRDAQSPGLRIAELGLIESIDVDSDTVFTINLSAPAAGLFYPLLADAETAPIATTGEAACTDVVAAGPFALTSYEDGVLVTMEKNESYWNADNVSVSGIEYIHTEIPEAALNALRADQADYAASGALVPFSSLSQVAAPVEGIVNPTSGVYQINMCITEESPLGDPLVRQALNFATDRDDINQRVFDGQSEPAWSLVPQDDPLYNDELTEIYAYDLDRAAELLAEAGYADGFEIAALTTPGTAQRIHEVLQAQWEEVGVTTNLTVTQNILDDWYLAAGASGDINAVPLLRNSTEDFTRNFSTEAFANVCDTPVPDIDACAADLSALNPTTEEYAQRYAECQVVVVADEVFGVLTAFEQQALLVDTERIGNLVYRVDAISQVQPDVTQIQVSS